jgi:hypothetical protein
MQNPRQIENVARDIYSAIYVEVNVSREKYDEVKGDCIDSWIEHLCSIVT